MPRVDWLNPAARDYQARRWARDRRALAGRAETVIRGAGSSNPDPGSITDRIRLDVTEPDGVFVTTTVPQPYGEFILLLYPSTLVRPDPVNSNLAYLTVTETGL